MTIEIAIGAAGPKSHQQQQPRRDSNSSNGCQDSPSDDDGYFTSAVSVQHKTSSVQHLQTIEAESGLVKKVVWPNVRQATPAQPSPEQHRHAHANAASTETPADKPMAWMKHVEQHQHVAEAADLEVQKRAWDATTGRRLSRSRSKSKNILERARSFERAAAEAASGGGLGSANNSRAPSRQGSLSEHHARGRRRSPSLGHPLADFWLNESQQLPASRPPSRAGRERSVGRVDTSQWEAATAKIKSDAPKSHAAKAPTAPEDHAGSPPPPIPPPPQRASRSVGPQDPQPQLGEATIQGLSQEDKDQIVEEWVRQTSAHAAARDELEQFAFEVAESVVSTMEMSQKAHEQHSVSSSATANASSAKVVSTSSSTMMTSQEHRSEMSCHQAVEQTMYSGLARATPIEINEVSNEEKRARDSRATLKFNAKLKEEESLQVGAMKEKSTAVDQEVRAASKKPLFAPNDLSSQFKKADSHFSQVKTGNVHEKRNFWMRSISTDKLNQHESSPGPRRRRLMGQDWIKQPSDSSRPGSSLGQVIGSSDTSQHVRQAASGWSDLAKSKSSAAVLQERPRAIRGQSKERKEFVLHQQVEEATTAKSATVLSEARTNQVHDTVHKWGQELVEPRSSTPNGGQRSRNIGEQFSDQKSRPSTEEKAVPWRSSKNPEPSVKVVNVAVENSVHISENAEAQIASFMKTEQSASSSLSVEKMGVVTQVPPKSPGPSRKGKSVRAPPVEIGAGPPRPDPLLPSTSSGQVPAPVASSQLRHHQESLSTMTSSSSSSSSKSTSALAVISSWLANEEQQLDQEIQLQQEELVVKTEKKAAINKPTRTALLNKAIINEDKKQDLAHDETDLRSQQPKQNGGAFHNSAMHEPKHQEEDSILRNDESKQRRAQELEEVAQAGKVSQRQREEEAEATRLKDLEILEARSKMLQQVASIREDSDDDETFTSQEKAAERAKLERCKELAEIAELRGKSNWESILSTSQQRHSATRTPDPELEEARNTIRNAAAKWQEREQSSQKVRYSTPPSGRNTPSRKIGNLFNRGSEHWSMDAGDEDEDFPAPPTDLDVQISLPAPPPRESSREVMMEYQHPGANSICNKK